MTKWEEELNSEQLIAVKHEGLPLLVLAGAGSGKTRVLTYKVAYLIQEKQVQADKILLLTFTNKAAGEMKERVRLLVGQMPGFAGTFHSFCAFVLRRWGDRIGLNHNFVIYDEDDRTQALKMAMKTLEIDIKKVKVSGIAAMISKAKNEMLTQTDFASMAKGDYQNQTAEIWQLYQKRLIQYQAVDFDDLLLRTVELLKKREIVEKLRAKFEHILVDEYQDTNKAQYLITKLLAGDGNTLTAVGDFSQSVYAWRGADFRNLAYLEKDYPNLTKVELTKNYRSSQNILDAAYGVIGNNTTHPILNLKAVNDSGSKLNLYEAYNEKDEAAFVLRKIANDNNYSKYAILYRTNAQSRTLEESFIRKGIPYVLVGGTKFYERKEIKDVLAYLKVIANNMDKVGWERIEKIGKRRKTAFETWITKTKEQNNFDQLQTVDLLAGVLRSTNYLSLYDEKDEGDLMRLENIKELASVAAEFANLSAFLENVALVQSEAQSQFDKTQEKVTLMTMHAAKGLEFEHVFVIGMEEGLFPHSRSLMDKEQLEEERRLCYVAITRAKKNLYFSCARERLYFGQRSNNVPSRFLAEIPSHLVEKSRSMAGKQFGRDNRFEFDAPTISADELDYLTKDDFEEIDDW